MIETKYDGSGTVRRIRPLFWLKVGNRESTINIALKNDTAKTNCPSKFAGSRHGNYCMCEQKVCEPASQKYTMYKYTNVTVGITKLNRSSTLGMYSTRVQVLTSRYVQ